MRTSLLSLLFLGAPVVLSAPLPARTAISSSEDSSLAGLQDGPPVLIWRKFYSNEQKERVQVLENFLRPTTSTSNTDSDDVDTPITLEDLVFLRKRLRGSRPPSTQDELLLPDPPIPTSDLLQLSQSDELKQSSLSAVETPTPSKSDERDKDSHVYGTVYPSRHDSRPPNHYDQYLPNRRSGKSPCTSLSLTIVKMKHYDNLVREWARQSRDIDIDTWVTWISEQRLCAAFAIVGLLIGLFLFSILVVEIADFAWRMVRGLLSPWSCRREIGLSGPERRLVAYQDDEKDYYDEDETRL